jgi:hypothetical protein
VLFGLKQKREIVVTHVIVKTWEAAWMHFSFGRRAVEGVILVTNPKTGQQCWLLQRTHHYTRPVNHFFYGVSREELTRMLLNGERDLVRLDLIEQVHRNRQRSHHLNICPAKQIESRDKLTLHKNPKRLKGELVEAVPLHAVGYFLVHSRYPT